MNFLSFHFHRKHKTWLITEFLLLYVGVPAFFYVYATRWNVHLAMWAIAACALYYVKKKVDVSWHELWHGNGWSLQQRKLAVVHFAASVPLVVLLTYYMAPERLFSFPLHRPFFWLVVMVLYPILSVLPQELLFRSFFFRRYGTLFHSKLHCVMASAMSFGLVHVIFHNWVSPTLSLIAGLIFARSYTQHRSLKWAVIEHAAYGCMAFTVGIGFYFLVGGIPPS